MDKIKSEIAEKYAQGAISFDKVVGLVGYEEAKKIEFLVATTKKSFKEGLE